MRKLKKLTLAGAAAAARTGGIAVDGHWVGYPRVPVGLRIQVAYAVCERLILQP